MTVTVYVLETGIYESMVLGVFSSAEKAMAAYPTSWAPVEGKDGYWKNGLDWNSAATVSVYTLDELDP